MGSAQAQRRQRAERGLVRLELLALRAGFLDSKRADYRAVPVPPAHRGWEAVQVDRVLLAVEAAWEPQSLPELPGHRAEAAQPEWGLLHRVGQAGQADPQQGAVQIDLGRGVGRVVVEPADRLQGAAERAGREVGQAAPAVPALAAWLGVGVVEQAAHRQR